MSKIKEILIGTNNKGKYREICNLLPNELKKIFSKRIQSSSLLKKQVRVLKKIHLLKLHIFQKKQI